MKKLVAYFSATGTTAAVAARLAEAMDADLFEIAPAVAYTREDLDWKNSKSRSTLEMTDEKSRPQMKCALENAGDYDAIYVGFPIWWYVAPRIVKTFLESLSLKGKTVLPFATSGGSGMEKITEYLRPSCPGGRILEGRVFPADVSAQVLKDWAEQV